MEKSSKGEAKMLKIILNVLILGSVNFLNHMCVHAQDRESEKKVPNQLSVVRDVITSRTVPLLGEVRSASWLLLASIRPSFDDPEFLIGLIRRDQESVRLVVQRPEGISIYNQVKALSPLHSNDATDLSKIKLTTRMVDGSSCKDLLILVKKWESMSIQIVPKNVLRLDAVGYDIDVRSGYGDRLVSTFEGGELESDRSPMIKLLADTARVCS